MTPVREASPAVRSLMITLSAVWVGLLVWFPGRRLLRAWLGRREDG